MRKHLNVWKARSQADSSGTSGAMRLKGMAIPVMEFQVQGYKNQHAQKKLFNFENLCSGEVSKSPKI